MIIKHVFNDEVIHRSFLKVGHTLGQRTVQYVLRAEFHYPTSFYSTLGM